ncbi:hypothetical protein JHK87_053738 [Glycine soja]|nr:hypothetical protein JHK87_053738 [Glycine soja]
MVVGCFDITQTVKNVARLAMSFYGEQKEDKKKHNKDMLKRNRCSYWNLEAKDSRLFGPVNMTDIVGRVIYRLRTCVDHGCVRNR